MCVHTPTQTNIQTPGQTPPTPQLGWTSLHHMTLLGVRHDLLVHRTGEAVKAATADARLLATAHTHTSKKVRVISQESFGVPPQGIVGVSTV